MNHSNIKFASVKFPETDKEYCFLTDMKTLKAGDQLVVDTAIGIKIAEFKKYDEAFPFASARRAKWVIQKVDTRRLHDLPKVDVADILEQSRKAEKKRLLTNKIDELSSQLVYLQTQLSDL